MKNRRAKISNEQEYPEPTIVNFHRYLDDTAAVSKSMKAVSAELLENDQGLNEFTTFSIVKSLLFYQSRLNETIMAFEVEQARPPIDIPDRFVSIVSNTKGECKTGISDLMKEVVDQGDPITKTARSKLVLFESEKKRREYWAAAGLIVVLIVFLPALFPGIRWACVALFALVLGG